MTKYLSNKLRAISFILICMIVWLHAQVIELSPNGIAVYVQHFFTEKITRIAVSFFFLISGFLFCYTIDQNHKIKSFKNKIKKRVSTLLIPFMIWNILCLILVVIIQNSSQINIYSSDIVPEYNFYDYIYQIIFDRPPIAYHLWFIRDLFVVTLISPVIYLLLRYLKFFYILIITIFYLFYWHIGFLSAVSIVFFTFGMYIAMYHKELPNIIFTNRLLWILPLVWFIFNLILETTKYGSMLTFFINGIMGILSIWISYDLLYKRCIERWLTLDIFSFSFFIYIVHEPMLTLCKKIYIMKIGVLSTTTALLFYFLSPIVLISCIIIIGRFLKHRTPTLYNLITGHR